MSAGSTLAMCRTCLAAVAVLLAACGSQPGSTDGGRIIPAGAASDGLVVAFGTEPNPPEKGDNTVRVTVRDAGGSPVTDGHVAVAFSMPAMPSMNMPAMRSDAPLRHEGEGRYVGNGQLSMGGTWNVAITVSRGADTLATRRLSVVAKE